MHKEHAYIKESFTSPCMYHTYKNTCMWACKHTSRFYCDHHLNWTHPAPPSGPDAPHCLHWTPRTSPSTLRLVLWIGHLIPNPLDRTPTLQFLNWTPPSLLSGVYYSCPTLWTGLLPPHPLNWITSPRPLGSPTGYKGDSFDFYFESTFLPLKGPSI
jgi:hypothetical protein